MGIYILLIVIVVLFFIEYKKSAQYLVSPSVVMVGSFLISVFIVLLNPQWDFYINAKTVLVIILMLTSFIIGSRIPIRIKTRSIASFDFKKESIYQAKVLPAYIMLALQWILLFVYARFFFQIGGEISVAAITNVRTWLLHNGIPNFYGHISHISFSIAAVYIFIALRQTIEDRDTKHIGVYLFIILPYFLIEITGTSRSGIIYIIAYILAIFVYFIQKKMNNNKIGISKQRKKILGIGIKTLFIVVVLFVILGNLTGKTAKLGIGNMISSYFGGSLYNLDFYIENSDKFSSPFFGYFTFPIVNSVFKMLGVNIPILDVYYFPMHIIPVKGGLEVFSPTNLYSCITKVMTDYGLVGMLIFYLLLGIMYGILYKMLIRSRSLGLILIYYGLLIMPLVGASAEYLFGTMIFAPFTFYRIIYIYMIFKLCIKKEYILG